MKSALLFALALCSAVGCATAQTPGEAHDLVGVPVEISDGDGRLVARLSVVVPGESVYPGDAAFGVWSAAVAEGAPPPPLWPLFEQGSVSPRALVVRRREDGGYQVDLGLGPQRDVALYLLVPDGARSGTWATWTDAGPGPGGRWSSPEPLLGSLKLQLGLRIQPPSDSDG
jgi:hypothetical protein